MVSSWSLNELPEYGYNCRIGTSVPDHEPPCNDIGLRQVGSGIVIERSTSDPNGRYHITCIDGRSIAMGSFMHMGTSGYVELGVASGIFVIEVISGACSTRKKFALVE